MVGSQAAGRGSVLWSVELCLPVGFGVNTGSWLKVEEHREMSGGQHSAWGPSFPLPAPCSPTGVCRVMKCKTGSPGVWPRGGCGWGGCDVFFAVCFSWV